MTEQEVNSYRFLSGEEPSDEMLEYVMHEVALEAAKANKQAMDVYFANLKNYAAEQKAVWNERIKQIQNNGQ